MPRLTTVITAGMTGLLAVPLLALAATPGSGTGCVPTAAISVPPPAATVTGTGASTDTAATATAASNLVWDGEQTGNAALIVAVGRARGVPAWGWVVAVATAMQESRLRNLPGGDRDSIGLFQQRLSQGWGGTTQLRSPAYQAGKFYDALLAVPGWQAMPLTQAADLVQRSAFPSAYARWTRPATVLVARLTAAHAGTASAGAWAAACGVGCPPARTGDSAGDPGPGCLPGQVVLARAATWLTAWQGGPVPYSMSTDPAARFGGYRRDCSGYVSMALGLPGPGLNTAALAAYSTPIAKTDLRAGDLLINPAPGGAGHVVIFDSWTSPTMDAYLAYEQSGDGGTHHRVIEYISPGGYQMSPFRSTK
jgi:hypothetical protein